MVEQKMSPAVISLLIKLYVFQANIKGGSIIRSDKKPVESLSAYAVSAFDIYKNLKLCFSTALKL